MPSSEPRNALLGKKYDSRREGKQSFHFNIKLVRPCRVRGSYACRPPACTFAAHFGIDPGTKQNHNGNIVPPAARRASTPAGPAAHAGAVSAARCRVNEALTASTARLRARRESGCGASLRVHKQSCRISDRNEKSQRGGKRRCTSR